MKLVLVKGASEPVLSEVLASREADVKVMEWNELRDSLEAYQSDGVILDYLAFTSSDLFLDTLKYLGKSFSNLYVFYPNITSRKQLDYIRSLGAREVISPKIDINAVDMDVLEKEIDRVLFPDRLADIVFDSSQDHSERTVPRPSTILINGDGDDVAFREFYFSDRFSITADISDGISDITSQDYSKADIVIMNNVNHKTIQLVRECIDIVRGECLLIQGSDRRIRNGRSDIHQIVYSSPRDFYFQCEELAIILGNDRANEVKGTVTAFIGAVGGAGTTTLALLHAKEWKQQNPDKKAIVVDFTLSGGDIGSRAGLTSTIPNIYMLLVEIMKKLSSEEEIVMNREQLKNYTQFSKETNCEIMTSPCIAFEDYISTSVSRESVAQIYNQLIEILRSTYDAVFLDADRCSEVIRKSALNYSDRIVLVSNDTQQGARHILRMLDAFSSGKKEKTRCILNRSVSNLQKDSAAVETLLKGTDRECIIRYPMDRKLADDRKLGCSGRMLRLIKKYKVL